MGTLFDRWLDTWNGYRTIPPDVLDELRAESGLAPVAVDLANAEFPCPTDDDTLDVDATRGPGLDQAGGAAPNDGSRRACRLETGGWKT